MILTDIEKNHYRFGACHVFALALHQELGYEMKFFWNTLPNMDDLNEDEPNGLIHAYAVSESGFKYDVNGLITEEDIEQIYSRIDYSRVRIESIDTVNKLMWAGILYLGEDDEVNFVREYIRENKEKFS